MCDMQKMPQTREDASCDEDSDMNFTAYQTVGATGAHYVTTSGAQLPVAKLQQNVTNGTTLQQVVSMVGGVGMGDGVQYVRALDGGATLQAGPQLISVPIALPGAKPGDPPATVQIQVLNPNVLQQQQHKYQMQIPIQGFQQGAVLTLAYSPEANETGGIQILGNTLPEGLQVLAAMPQEMQLMQPGQAQHKDPNQQNIQHQVFVTQNQQIIIGPPGDAKLLNNNNNLDDIVIKEECEDYTIDDVFVTQNQQIIIDPPGDAKLLNNNNNLDDIVIKEECEDYTIDDESSQGTEASDSMSWQTTAGSHADLVKYLNTLPPQQTQALPASLQQFLRLNPSDNRRDDPMIEMEVTPVLQDRKDVFTEAILGEDGTLRIQTKKKKKYKKKPPKPARPKPGQVVIAEAADGTPIFCCPECQMAYPEKEQLEMHLIVHKIERRFICGICGAGLKRKEHLERHKLGHNPERPYVCGVCRKGFKRREHLNLHTVIHSGVKTEMCGECGKGFYRKDHLRKHTRSHEMKRARDEAAAGDADVKPLAPAAPAALPMPEITIHVPTSANMQVPVQINIPQHVVSSIAAAQQAAQQAAAQQAAQQAAAQQAAQQQASSDAQAQLDALLAQHS